MSALAIVPPPAMPSRTDGKLPAHDLKAEATVLTTMLLRPETIAEVLAIAAPEDFFSAAHRALAQAIRDLHASNKPVDEVTVHIELERTGKFRMLGDEFIDEMISACPVIANHRAYAGAIRDHAVKRQLAQDALRVYAQCFEPGDPRPLVESLGTAVRDLSVTLTRGATVSLMDTARQIARDRLRPPDVNATTGVAWLDAQIGGGIRKGQLFYFGAASGSGKSVLACQAAVASLLAGKRVLYASFEMARDEILERLACTLGDVSYVAYASGRLGPEAGSRFNLAMMQLVQDMPLALADRAGMTVMELEAEAVAHKADLVIADYVQQLLPPRGKRFGSRREEVEAVSRELKTMAMNHKLSVIAPCQLSRSSAQEGRRPVMTDLREAGGLENDADGIIFVWRPQAKNAEATPDERNAGELIIGKLRRLPYGQSTQVRLGPSGFEVVL